LTDYQQNQIRNLIIAVFQGWKQAGIPFMVLRNYEQLPEFTSNDVDVLISPEDLSRAEECVVSAARGQGFDLLLRAEFAVVALFLGHESGAQTHFDLCLGTWWRGFELVDVSAFLQRRMDRGLFAIPHPVDEAVNSLIGYLIHAGKVKEKYRAKIQEVFLQHPADAQASLAPVYGGALAKMIVENAGKGSWEAIEKQVPALRRALIVRQLTRRPMGTLGFLLKTCTRWIRRWFNPPGISVVLCGADGCGKSTATALLVQELAGTFPADKGAHYHWKPPVFTGKRQAARAPVTAPHAIKPRALPVSLAFFALHWVEFVLGAVLRLHTRKFKGGLTIIDRYYYDFFVDQRRYRLQVPLFLVRLGYWFLPKPDLVFALDAPTAVLRQRKQEVPEAETERQRQAYADLVRGLPNGRVIDATQPPEAVAASMRQHVFDLLRRRRSAS
jgi:thymidylate kinase